MTRFRIEKLTRHHAVDGFDCGEAALNHFLSRFALSSQQAFAAQTYLGLADDQVAGFYTLAVGAVEFDGAATRLKKGLARHPVPVMLLARLAVDVRHQGIGVGAGLLKDAILRTLAAADIAGIRVLVVHAKDDKARAFYEHFDFVASPTDALHLYALNKDLRAIT